MSTTEPGPIVVGVNGSAASDAAVRFAVMEARHAAATLKLVHVMPEHIPTVRPYTVPLTEVATAGRELLRQAERVARAEWPEVTVEPALVTGRWIDAIMHATEGAREIVLGHDPGPSLQRLATGSAVLAVATRSRVPVIVVQPVALEPLRGRVAVGLKDARKSYGLLRMAFQQAADRGSELAIIHAWEMPPGYESLAGGAREREEISHREALAIEELAHGLRQQFPSTKAVVEAIHGNPARVLQRESESSDLLLLARRLHALPRGHIGGTAHALLRHSSCPVAILPAADEPAHLSAASPT